MKPRHVSVARLKKAGGLLHYKGVWDWDPKGVSTLKLNVSKDVLNYTYGAVGWSLTYTLKDSAKGTAVLNITLPDGNRAEFQWVSMDTIKGKFWQKGRAKAGKPATQVTMELVE